MIHAPERTRPSTCCRSQRERTDGRPPYSVQKTDPGHLSRGHAGTQTWRPVPLGTGEGDKAAGRLSWGSVWLLILPGRL